VAFIGEMVREKALARLSRTIEKDDGRIG